MLTEYERRIEERKMIRQETASTIKFSLALMTSVVVLGGIAYGIRPTVTIPSDKLEKIIGIVNIAVVMMMVVILAIRKTIYYSPKIVKEDFTLRQVLQKWRSIDMILLAVSEIIPILGLVMAVLGMPFRRTFHFFVAAGLLMLILMPIGLKVRSKLAVLRKHTRGE